MRWLPTVFLCRAEGRPRNTKTYAFNRLIHKKLQLVVRRLGFDDARLRSRLMCSIILRWHSCRLLGLWHVLHDAVGDVELFPLSFVSLITVVVGFYLLLNGVSVDFGLWWLDRPRLRTAGLVASCSGPRASHLLRLLHFLNDYIRLSLLFLNALSVIVI